MCTLFFSVKSEPFLRIRRNTDSRTQCPKKLNILATNFFLTTSKTFIISTSSINFFFQKKYFIYFQDIYVIYAQNLKIYAKYSLNKFL